MGPAIKMDLPDRNYRFKKKKSKLFVDFSLFDSII